MRKGVNVHRYKIDCLKSWTDNNIFTNQTNGSSPRYPTITGPK